MAARDRIRRYRDSGGAADFVRVEVLLPASRRSDILDAAARLRQEHREHVRRLDDLCAEALASYGVRILDHIDLDRVHDRKDRAKLIAGALMDHGDARAFALARRILADVEAP